MPLIIDDGELPAKSRIVGLRLVSLTLRLMENWKHDVDDYDRAMILLAVATITAERLLRASPEPHLESLSTPMPPEALAKCNVSSIASATGLNRETTRRKVDDLVKAGLLRRLADGTITFTEGLIQNESTQQLVRTQLEVLVRSLNDLMRDGVVGFATPDGGARGQSAPGSGEDSQEY